KSSPKRSSKSLSMFGRCGEASSALKSLLCMTYQQWIDDNAFRMAAALAYYTMFSLAPLDHRRGGSPSSIGDHCRHNRGAGFACWRIGSVRGTSGSPERDLARGALQQRFPGVDEPEWLGFSHGSDDGALATSVGDHEHNHCSFGKICRLHSSLWTLPFRLQLPLS